MYPQRRTFLLQTLSLLSTSCFVAFAFASSRPIHADDIVVAHRPRSNGRNLNHHPPFGSTEFTSSYSSIAANQPNHLYFKPSNRLKNWPLAAFHQGNNHRPSNRHHSKPRQSNLQHRQFKDNSNTNNNSNKNYNNNKSRMCQPPSALSATTNNSDKRRYPQRGGGRSTEREALLPTSRSPNTRSRESSTRSTTTTSSSSSEFTLSTLAKTLTSSKKAKGRAILLLVSFLYGTLNVSLRGIYASEGPPVASVLSLARQCLSVVTFLPILWSVQNQSNGRGGGGVDAAVGEKDLEYGTAAGYAAVEKNVEGKEKKRPMWLAALELAFWNFGAQGLINAGLLFSPAARASFLTQTSVVMTPLISALAGERVKSSVWGGCALALFGLGLISTSHSPATTDAAVDLASALTDDAIASSSQRALMTASEVATTSSLNRGDFMILAGALSWSTYIFRTSSVAKSYSELDLQFSKNVLLAVMYFGWFLTTAVTSLLAAAASASTSLPSLLASGTWIEALTPLWSGWASLPVWMLLAYSAVGPGAVADLLQQSGQKEVSASESNIILCFESLFAAVCAFVFLGEVSSAKEMTGGLFIVMAAILASK